MPEQSMSDENDVRDNSLVDQFRDPPTLDEFANIMMNVVQSAGDTRCAKYDKAESRLIFTIDGKNAGMMNLRSLYREYCAVPQKKRKEWIRETTLGMINLMEIPDDFEDVKPDLLPSVRPKSMFEINRLSAEVQGLEWNDMVVEPLSEHLVVCLVYDLPNSMRFVSQDDLKKWGTTVHEAMEVAKRSLEEKPFAIKHIKGELYILTNGDSYDATRMLMVDVLRSLRLSGDPMALPLARDALLICGSNDQKGLGLMFEFAKDKKDCPRPVCPLPHRLVNGEWQLWVPPPHSPHINKVRWLEIEYLLGEYSEQERLMRLRNGQIGADVNVASFTAIAKEEKVLTYSVWSDTVPTWLPKSQYVALVGDGQDLLGFVPWERVVTIMGASMSPKECYPPRWSVEAFPDQCQLAELKPGRLPL